jgi:hypothetical protein
MAKHSPLALESTSKMIMNGDENGLAMLVVIAWLSNSCSCTGNEQTTANISTDETPARTTKLPSYQTFSHEGLDWYSSLPKNLKQGGKRSCH